MSKLETIIPKGWQKKQIKDLLDYERPDKYIVESDRHISTGKTPVLTANKSFILGYTDENFGIYDNIPAIIFDDFTTDSKYVDFSFKIKSSAINILKNKKDTDLRFIFEKMKSITFPTGSHKRFYISQYQDMEIVVPPLSEQKKIAEILSTVNEEIKKTDEIIVVTEKLKNGLMQKLFTRGIGHTKFKKTEIGEIPAEWDIKELGGVCDVRDGTHSSPKYHQQGIPLVTSKNLVGDALDFDNVSLITDTDYKEIEKRSHVDDGDILFGMIGTIGNPVIVRKNRDFAIKNVALVKFPEKTVSNIYVLNYLKSIHTLDQFHKKMGGSTQKFVALGMIRKLLISIPPVSEQRKIAEILTSIDERISINQKIKEKLTSLKLGLMQDLLSGKVRTTH